MILDIRKTVSVLLAETTGLLEADIFRALEIPKTFEHGHLAFPVFALAKLKKMAPPVIAKEMAENISGKNISWIQKVEAVSGFVNFTFTNSFMQEMLLADFKNKQGAMGSSKDGAGKTVVIDYSSPNVAKPMHVGHLRATVIGQALRNLAASQGFKVIGVNHLGDWGTQFGKLAWAMQNWASEYPMGDEAMDSLLKMYVRFHEESAKRPELEKFAAENFKKLENGDAEIQTIWKNIIQVSLKEYEKIYQTLNVKHDVILGESFYNDKMAGAVERLEKANLLKDSEGAQVVFFDEKDNMPPCLIKKSDGASIYATRDLAAAIYRREVQKGDQLLYVVGQEQSLHFKQVFKVLELLGYDWAKNCHHLAFGLYHFKDGKMSTRQGRMILAEDILNQVIQVAKETIQQKNPDLENKELVAKQVGVGAVLFNDLINDRAKNVEFDLEKILSMEGDSGPYVQYSLVRCRSVLRKIAETGVDLQQAKFDFTMESEQERKLIFLLLQFQDVVAGSYRTFKPNILAQYLLELCGHFSHFYHHQRILADDKNILAARGTLVKVTEAILSEGLAILNIPTPEAM